MKSLSDHLAHLHKKPHHVRKKIAFSAAAAGAGGIALVWLVANLSLGTFVIRESSFADAVKLEPVQIADNGNEDENSGLAGAIAALPNTGTEVPAHIEIVETVSTTSQQKKVEQTIIPF